MMQTETVTLNVPNSTIYLPQAINQSAITKDLFAALAKAQGQIKGASKDSENPFFKSNYADLAAVWDACREALSTNGLCVIQTTEYIADAGGICVVTTLGHLSGQWTRGILPILAEKKTPQGIGSAITYMRRYALAAIVGIYQVDDDAEGATNRDKGKTPAKAAYRPELGPNAIICEFCKHEVKLNPKTNTYFCTNYADTSTNHVNFPAAKIEGYMTYQKENKNFA